MAVNFRAPFLLAQAMLKGLPADGAGKVINLNDWRTARAKRFAYGTSKAALSGLTRSLAVAMAPRVQVNELALGAILPPADTAPRLTEQMETNLGPAGRMGALNEVTQAVLSLIGNDFITGETLHIDGGRHIQ
jgi:pteridine reductase